MERGEEETLEEGISYRSVAERDNMLWLGGWVGDNLDEVGLLCVLNREMKIFWLLLSYQNSNYLM